MNFVKFGKYHSFEDFSLILNSKTIETPTPKEEYVEVPGSNEPLDYTEFYGDIIYNTRKITCEFETTLRRKEFYDLFRKIATTLNGRRLNIIFSEEPFFYFNGRIKVNEYASKESIGRIVIEATCNPYQKEMYETYNSFTLNGNERTINLVNLRERITPTIIVEANEGEKVGITWGDRLYSYELGNGTYQPYEVSELILSEGNNQLTLSGNGKITFKYRRGKL